MNRARAMNHAELAAVLKQGTPVNILLESHTIKELKKVRTSTVLAAEPERLILTWPEPSLPRPVLGTVLEVSFMLPVDGRPQRHSYKTRVSETLFATEASNTATHQAVVVDFPSPEDLSPSTLRLFLRTTVPQEMGIVAKVASWGECPVLDLSNKGLSFAMPVGKMVPAKGDPVSMVIQAFGESLDISGHVVGLVELEDVVQISVEISGLAVTTALALKMLIRQIEAAAAGKGLV